MRSAKRAVSMVWLSACLLGCPLVEDPQAVEPDSAPGKTDDPASGDGDGDEDGDGDVDAGTGDGDGDVDADTGDGDGDVDAGTGDGDGDVDAGTGDGDGGAGDGDGDGDGDVDAAVTADAGADQLDASQPEDAGEPELDAGQSEPDAGEPQEDAGTPIVAPDLGPADMTDADRALRIQSVMTTEDYLNTWYPLLESSTAMRALVSTSNNHGTRVRVFQNAVAKQAIDAWVAGNLPSPLVMPNGSIVVKQTFKLNADMINYDLNNTVVMAKVDVLDPTMYEGNWFYMRIDLANVASRSTSCVNCHNGRTNKVIWPITETNTTGGLVDGVVPYDYLFVAYCYDPATPECAAPH